MNTNTKEPIVLTVLKKERDATTLEIERLQGRYDRAQGDVTEAQTILKTLRSKCEELSHYIEEHEPKQLTKAEALLERMVKMYSESGNRFTEKQKYVIATILNEEDAK
jgi:chromosome segregation ATPase